MNVHKNAKLTPRGRAEIVRRVLGIGEIVFVGLMHAAEREPAFSSLSAKRFDIVHFEDQLGRRMTWRRMNVVVAR